MTTPAANPNKALWEKGDFTQLAACMRRSGEELVASLGITEDTRVLDVGCGDGTTAVPEAQLGADVLGVDISRPPRGRGQRAGGGSRPLEPQLPGG